MVEDQSNYANQFWVDISTRIRDLEERQRILKNRLLLIGQNLIELREKNNEEMLEIKKLFEKMRQDMERIRDFLEAFSGEISKFAKKEDLNILAKQAKMFQPLEFVRKSDLEKLRR